MSGAEAVQEAAGAAPTRPTKTSLGLIEGDVLLYLDRYGATPIRRIIRDLEWPSPMVTMAIGALIREELVRAKQHELELILEPLKPVAPNALVTEPVPEVWGG